MTARVLKGTKQEIAEQLAGLEGEVREAIVFVEEPVAPLSAEALPEDIFAEMEPYMTDVADFDDSRDAIYERQEGE